MIARGLAHRIDRDFQRDFDLNLARDLTHDLAHDPARGVAPDEVDVTRRGRGGARGDWARRAATGLARSCRRLAAAGTLLALAAVIVAAGAAAQTARKDKSQAASESDAAAGKDAQKNKPSPAEAQAAVDAALKQLEAGKSEAAAQALTNTLAAGRLPPAIMAKALLYRGMAYRQQKKPAQAIADLTSALWLKGGLTDSERADALKQRAAAYEEAGLTDSGAALAAVPRHTNSSDSAAWGGTTKAAVAGDSGAAAPQSSGWNFFGDLFGLSSTPSPAPPPPPPTPAAAAPTPAGDAVEFGAPASASTKAASGWTRNTHVHGGTPQLETAAVQVAPEGRIRIQVGMVRTHDQAQAMAVKIKSQYGQAVGQREPEIDEAVVGNMGSFYRVRVGPFASPQEGQAACAKLKGSGFDCLVVTQ
jgi:tetratricopeptide (TPR) repeat protein